MDDESGWERLSFLGRRCPPAFGVRVIVVPPGCSRPYSEADWRGAIVVVERGEVELEHMDGTSHRFGSGDILYLDGLPLRFVHCRGPVAAVLTAVTRRPRAKES
jgi:quercetin dioxygenase-like cupin family protein